MANVSHTVLKGKMMLRPLLATTSSVRKLTLSRALAGGHGGPAAPIYIPKPAKGYVETGGSDVPQPTLYTDPHHVHNPGPPVTLDLMAVPQYCYYDVHGELNRKFNKMLGVTALFALSAFGYAYYTDTFCFDQTARAPASYYKRGSPMVKLPEKPKDDVPPPAEVVEPVETAVVAPVQVEAAPVKVEEVVKERVVVPPFYGMDTVPYLLIGGGTASYYAALSIRARDADAKVVIVGEESDMPYNRPPLSKELWWYGDSKVTETLEYKGVRGKPRDIYYESQGFYVKPEELGGSEHGAVSLVKGRKVVKLDVANHVAVLDDGTKLRYGKCLIATGTTPKTVDVLENVKDKTVTVKTVADFQHLDELARKPGSSIAVVGGGLLGSELAHAMAKRYRSSRINVNQIVSESGILADLLPEFLVEEFTKQMTKNGVTVHANGSVTKAEKSDDGKVKLTLSTGEVVEADAVVVDAGAEPNVAVGRESGLAVDEKNGGLVADAYLKAADDVWVAGDVCSYEDPVLGRRRYEQWEHSQVLGRQAGENMTGGSKKLPHRGSFFSILGSDVHFNAIGDVSSKLNTVSVFARPQEGSNPKGVVFYQAGHKVVGVVIYNVFGDAVEIARRIIADHKDLSADDLKDVAKLFELYVPA